jgi:hypothetical protein
MGRWSQRRRCGTDNTAAKAAIVVSVQKIAGNHLLWTFNVNVNVTASPISALNDDTLSSSGAPTASVQSGAKGVDCTYSVTPNVGDHYSISITPTGLGNPNGSGFIIPQGGNVT